MVQRRKIIYKDAKVSTTTQKQLLIQPSPQTVNHTLPYFKVESGSEEARISEGYQSEVYFCTRTLINKESLVTADRTSTFRISSMAYRATSIDQLDTSTYAAPTMISILQCEPSEHARIHLHQKVETHP